MYTDTISCIVINEHYPGINPIQFGYQYCEPKWAYGTVIRDYWLLHYVVYGCGVLKLGGQEYSVKAGEMFVIPPGVASFYEADEKDPWFYIWVGFTTDMRLPSSMTQPVVPCKGIELYFKEMQKCETMKRGRSAYLNSCIWKIYSFFLDANYLNKHSEAEELNDPVSQATHYINSNYMEPIKVEDIAKLLHLDRTYFSALFTKKWEFLPKNF